MTVFYEVIAWILFIAIFVGLPWLAFLIVRGIFRMVRTYRNPNTPAIEKQRLRNTFWGVLGIIAAGEAIRHERNMHSQVGGPSTTLNNTAATQKNPQFPGQPR